jgi:hypothetical protein
MFGDLIYGVDMFGQVYTPGLGPHYLFTASGFHEIYALDSVLTLSYANNLLLINT